MPAPQFAQNQVGVVAGIVDISQNCRAADFTRVVDDDVAKAKYSLGDAG